MNKVLLIGRLTRDAEIRYSQGQNGEQMAIAKFSLAVDRRTKKENEQNADFINCVCFGKTAEFAEKYLRQGTKIAVEGRWQTGSFTNKDGQKVYTNDCVIEQAEFAESKKSADQTQSTTQQKPDDFVSIPDGIELDLPFK